MRAAVTYPLPVFCKLLDVQTANSDLPFFGFLPSTNIRILIDPKCVGVSRVLEFFQVLLGLFSESLLWKSFAFIFLEIVFCCPAKG